MYSWNYIILCLYTCSFSHIVISQLTFSMLACYTRFVNSLYICCIFRRTVYGRTPTDTLDTQYARARNKDPYECIFMCVLTFRMLFEQLYYVWVCSYILYIAVYFVLYANLFLPAYTCISSIFLLNAFAMMI